MLGDQYINCHLHKNKIHYQLDDQELGTVDCAVVYPYNSIVDR